MNNRIETELIVATLVDEENRMDFLPTVFGPRFMLRGETLVYSWMGKLCSGYAGAYWNFFKLSNGGFYLAPAKENKLAVSISSNSFEGEFSADAAGILATLFALDQLAKEQQGSHLGDLLADRYRHLRNFAKTHPEAIEIFRAID